MLLEYNTDDEIFYNILEPHVLKLFGLLLRVSRTPMFLLENGEFCV